MAEYKKILCLDFDGVIHSYKSGQKGPTIIPDPPVDGALEFIYKATKFFRVSIFSSRSATWLGRRAMKKWLSNAYFELGMSDYEDIPQWYWNHIVEDASMDPWNEEIKSSVRRLMKLIEFPSKKPAAFLSIDDRGWHFDGTFPDPEELLQFKTQMQK